MPNRDKPSGGAAEPTEATRLWRGVATGRVSVKRHYDEGGRRYLVLGEVAANHDRNGAEQLNERERQVVGYRAYGQSVKRIAGELGVSQPTVVRALASARKKLGVASDLDLPAIFAAGLRRRSR
jgi:DNA-binding CsgD family transcriptional regulator